MRQATLSVCVTVKNRSRWVVDGCPRNYFPEMVDSLAAALPHIQADIELVVTDWDSTDWPLQEWLPQKFPKSRILPMKGQFSRGAGLNQAAKAANGDILFFCDTDMLVDSDFLNRGISICQQGKAFFPICQSGTDYADRSRFWWRDTGFGMCFVNHQDFARIGPFDEKRIWGTEDIEFCHRLSQIIPIVRHKTKGLFHQHHPSESLMVEDMTDYNAMYDTVRKIARESDFNHWFGRICVPDLVAQAKAQPIAWQGRPLEWEVCHEILAFHRFSGIQVEELVEFSNARYGMLDAIWPGKQATMAELDRFYNDSSRILPWGHGLFIADHNTQERRDNWMRQVAILEDLRQRGADSLIDYGAGAGHTSLLAVALGFGRVVHHDYPVFHPYVSWRASAMGASGFQTSDVHQPLPKGADAVVCLDVAEHVHDPDRMLDDIRGSLIPGGLLAWVAQFGGGISCHLHEHLKGKEEEMLSKHGFKRIAPLPARYHGHSGLYSI